MAIKSFYIGRLRITLVGKYRYYKKEKSPLDLFMDWREWELGIWFKKNLAVGKKDFKHPEKWKDNFVNDYMLGINLLIIKGWINWNVGAMQIDID
jgi:hypothetical protein